MGNRSGWTWAAALCLALSVLPSAVGAGGWVAPLLVLPGVWAGERLLCRVDGDGLAAGFCRVLGKKTGRALTIIYMVWAAVLGGVQLRGSVRRLAVAVSPEIPAWLLAVLVVGLALWFARGKTDVCARWGRIVMNVLLTALIALAVLALGQVRWEELLPPRFEGVGLLRAAAVTLGAFCVRVYGGFLVRDAKKGAGVPWYSAAVCGLLALLLMTAQGALGVELVVRLEDPLLTLSRNVGVEGTFQRVESLLASGLLLADLALLTLLLWAAACGIRWRRAVVAALMGAGVLTCALWPAEESFVKAVRQWVVPGVNLILGLAIPAAVAGIDALKKRKEGAYLVSKDEK